MSAGEYSVYWWDAHGGQHEELRFVTDIVAMGAVTRLTQGPASKLGLVRKVIVTDGGDCCAFEWVYGRGVVFPPLAKLR